MKVLEYETKNKKVKLKVEYALSDKVGIMIGAVGLVLYAIEGIIELNNGSLLAYFGYYVSLTLYFVIFWLTVTYLFKVWAKKKGKVITLETQTVNSEQRGV